MLLEALELVERADIGVRVIQMHDEADDDLLILHVIDERAAAGGIVERPAESVLHQAGMMFFRRDFPEFLQPDAEFLRLAVA